MLRLILSVPRKLVGGLFCLYENGWSYTWYHAWEKIGRVLYLYGRESLPYREVRRRSTNGENDFQPSQFINPPTPRESRVVTLFAMYNPNGRVPDATWIYMKGLRASSDELIVCSDSAVCPDDVNRIKTIASCGMFEQHGEYDFGSWKRAYGIAEGNGYLRNCSTLMLANDSCVGPVFPLADMMSSMKGRKCDFWGQTSYSYHRRPHVQSYFTAFSQKIVESGALGEFLESLGGYRSRAEVISSCEIAMTEFLVGRGFKWDSYVPYRAVLKNPTCSPCTLLKRYACPLIKIKALMGETFEPLKDVHEAIKSINPAIHDAICAMADDWECVSPWSGLHD